MQSLRKQFMASWGLMIALSLPPRDLMAAEGGSKPPKPSVQQEGASKEVTAASSKKSADLPVAEAPPGSGSADGVEEAGGGAEGATALPPLGHPNSDVVTLGQLDRVQQNTLLLQAELEQQRVAKQLQDLSQAPGGKGSDRFVLSAGNTALTDASKLQLVLVYGKTSEWRARLAYEKSGQVIEVQTGDTLPTGEKVSEVGENFVIFDSGKFQWKVSI